MQRRIGPAADAPPLDPERLFRRLAGVRGLVLAVSGGPDSTALMVLAARWAARPPILVVTVDHGLRPEAEREAELVARNAEKLGLAWRIMRAPGRAGGNLQDWARRERYRLLAEAAREAGCDAVVTAHHRDDQAETFLLRLARGSGVYGLAAMAEEGIVDGLRLARPLLAVQRETLAAVAAASALPTVDDPSNADMRFDRVRMRGLMPALAAHGLTVDRLAGTASRLGRAAAALDFYVRRLLDDHVRADRFGVVAGSARALTEAPEEIGLRALALIVTAVGGADYTPRLDRLEAVLAELAAAAADARLKRTLHGVVLSLDGGRLTAQREWGRTGIPTVPAPAGATLVWDRRFRLGIPMETALSAGPLGKAGQRLRSAKADPTALRTLPGLFRGETLVAVPEGVTIVDGGPAPLHFTAECLVAERLTAQTRPAGHHSADARLQSS